MKPSTISQLIKDTMDSVVPNSQYLRATDEQANIASDQIDLQGITFVLYNNLAEVGTESSGELSGGVTEIWPIEIRFLVLADLSDNTEESDALVDDFYEYARRMYGIITQSDVLKPELLEDENLYQIIRSDDTQKIYDKTMTGVLLTFELRFQTGVRCV